MSAPCEQPACPQVAQHTPWPDDPREGAEKAEQLLAEGYEQLRCGGCGLWRVWRKKLSAASAEQQRGQLKSPARAPVIGNGAGDRNSRGRR